jgi:hypothetical protein
MARRVVEEIQLDYKLFIDRTVIFYGPTRTGKSTLIQDALKQLSAHINQIIVICPTDNQNQTYSCGIVKKPLIHTNLNEDLLKKIWERQEVFATIYKRANNIATLESLFKKLNLGHVNRIIEKAHVCLAEQIATINETVTDTNMQKVKKKSVEDQYQEFTTLVYKRFISENRDALLRLDLTGDERHAVKYLDFNPRMVLVLDDCTADFEKLKSKEGKMILDKIFFQGRWAFLTVLIAAHGAMKLNGDLRGNAYVSFFTNKSTAIDFFSNKKNAFTREQQRNAEAAANEIFAQQGGFQKMVWIRPDEKIGKCTATIHEPFTFGSNVIQKYCEKIESNDDTSIDQSNNFGRYFQ